MAPWIVQSSHNRLTVSKIISAIKTTCNYLHFILTEADVRRRRTLPTLCFSEGAF